MVFGIFRNDAVGESDVATNSEIWIDGGRIFFVDRVRHLLRKIAPFDLLFDLNYKLFFMVSKLIYIVDLIYKSLLKVKFR